DHVAAVPEAVHPSADVGGVGAEGGVVAEVEDRESAQVGDHVGSIHKRPAPTRARPAPLSPDGVPGRLSPVAGSLALGVARFLVACWLGGWRRWLSWPCAGACGYGLPALRARTSVSVECQALGLCGGLPRWRRCGGPSSGTP